MPAAAEARPDGCGGTVAEKGSTPVGIVIGLVFVAAALLLLLVPWFIARRRGVATRGWLLVVDLLFGWSVLGWFVCLLWAALGETEDAVRIRERQLRRNGERIGR